MGDSPQMNPTKFKLFTHLSWTHETFKVSKHKGKIKFDKILGVPKWAVLSKLGR